jgi:autotransporter translocation and assembly factor TamB
VARPGRWRRFVLRPLFWLLAALALAVFGVRWLLSTDYARERARVLIETRLAEAMARPVELGGLDFRLLPFEVVATDLRIPGDRAGAADFARARRIELAGRLEGFSRRELVLDRVAVDGLVLGIEMREDGDNLPRFGGGGGGGELRVSIGSLEVTDAAVVVDERRVDVEVRARAVAARLAGVGGTDLEGTVAAQEVLVRLPDSASVPFAVAGKARLLSDRVELSNVRVSAPEASAQVSGRVTWKGGTTVDLTAALDVDGRLLDRFGWLDGEIAGPAHAEGIFGWRKGSWSFRADVTSPGLDLFGFRLDEVAGEATGGPEAVRFDLARGRIEGGSAHGRFELGLGAGRPARLELAVEDADLDRVLARFDVPVSGLAGAVSGPFRYDFELARAAAGRGEGDFTIAPIERPGAEPALGSARVVLAGGAAELPAFELTLPGQRVSGSARFEIAGGAGRVDLAIASDDLGTLAGRTRLLPEEAIWRPAAGGGEIGVRLVLARGAARAEFELALDDVEAPGARADRVEGTLVATDSGLERLRLLLERDGARLAVAGDVPFDERAAGLDLELLAEGWPVEEARPWLPFELPVAGPLQGRVELTGSLAELAGRVTARVEPAEVAGIGATRLDAALDFDPTTARIAELRLETSAGVLTGGGSIALAGGGLDLAFATSGLELARPPLEAAEAAGLAGRAVFSGRVDGTLERPGGEVEGVIEGFTLRGEPAGGTIATFSARLADGRLAVRGDLPDLLAIEGGGDLDFAAASRIELELASVRLDRLIALAAPTPLPGLEGSLAGRLTLFVDPDSSLAAELVVPTLELRHAGRSVRNLEPVAARFDAEGLTVESFYLGRPGSEDEMFVAGRARFGPEAALDLNVEASLAAEWLAPFAAGVDFGGRVELLGRVRGTPSRPQVNGQAGWSGGRWLPPGFPHGFEEATALALFYPDAVVLDRLGTRFAGGELTAAGRVELPGPDRPLDFRVEAAVRGATVRWPAGWQLRGDADLSMAGGAESRQIRGEVRLDRIWYTQDLNLTPAQLVQRLLSRSRVEVAETDEFLSTTALAVALRGPDAVRVRNNLARLSGSAEMAVRGSLARPVLFGDVTIDPGGTVEYGGNRYEIERAELAFVNPARIDPLLDVVARTRIDPYQVTVNLSGTLERLSTGFTSDPPLPDLDVLGLLATGAPVEGPSFSEAAASAAGPASSAGAEALLYGQAASLLTERVGRLFGFDQVRVRPLTTGDTVSAASVTVGKRLSRRIYVTYTIDPSSDEQQILQVEWRLSESLKLVLTQNGNDSYAVDARWEARF